MSPDEQPDKPKQTEKTDWVRMTRYAELAIVFPAATVIGLLIGIGLDHWLHTDWLYIPGLILGILAGFVELIRAAMQNS